MKTKRTDIIALLPMRHNSIRVKGKNYKKLGRKMLFEYVLESLIKSNSFKKIIVNTDSPIIKDKIKKKYKNIIIHNRPKKLCSGMISMNKIIEFDCKKIDNEYVFQTHSTNPFLSVKTIKQSIKKFLKYKNDSLFSVNIYKNRLWSKKLKPLNHNPSKLIRTQDLPELLEENSLFYIFKRKNFLALKNRIMGKKNYFITSPRESLDIDNQSDWEYAKYLNKL